MPEFIDEETFLNLVSDRLADTPGVDFDGQTDHVSGDLGAIAIAVLDVYSQHGPVMFGD